MSKKRKGTQASIFVTNNEGSALIIYKTVADRTLPADLPPDVHVAWLDAKRSPLESLTTTTTTTTTSTTATATTTTTTTFIPESGVEV